jgi:hypothetical protein
MKLSVTFDFADETGAVGVMLEGCLHDMVKEFNRNAPGARVSVFRVRVLNDWHYQRAMERLAVMRGLHDRSRAQ